MTARGRRLKVFQAPFGFYDSVVAASSQAAALRAWGSHQNLFAEGVAKLATDARAIEAALEHPETPLRRAIGSTDPFEIEPRSLPKIRGLPKSAKPRPTAKAQEPPPPDRFELDAAEAALRKVEDDWKDEQEDLRRRRRELDEDEAEARSKHDAAKKRATVTLKERRHAYRKAGGTD